MKGLVGMHLRDWSSLVLLGCLVTIAALAVVSAAEEVTPPPVGSLFINQVNSPATITSRDVFVNGDIIIESGGGLTITDAIVTVNTSVIVNSFGSLMLVNSTLRFNCTPFVDNFLRVEESGTLIVRDRDANRETTGDRSVITSVSLVRYNITVLGKASLRILESLIQRAGRHSPLGNAPEGVLVMASNAEVRGTRFEQCYAGLVIDSAEKVVVSNCTFDQPEYTGIFVRGAIQATVEDCTVTRSLDRGILMRGFASKVRFNRCAVSGSTNAELELITLSGDGNFISDCTFGPGKGHGVLATEAEDITITGCTVTRCATGMGLLLSKLTVKASTITNCTKGLDAVSGTYTLEDVSLLNTTAVVDPSVAGNLTCKLKMRYERSRLDLGRFLVVQTGGVLNASNTTLSFRLSKGATTGLIVESQGTLGMVDCLVDSPVSRLTLFRLLPLSVFELRNSTIADVGSAASAAIDKGLYVAGGGLIQDIVVQDGEHGLVVGRTQARVIGVTVKRCSVGIMSDGQVGPGGIVVERLAVEDCGRVAVLQNDGSLTIVSSDLAMGQEGFNLTRSLLNVRDSVLQAPDSGGITAYLTGRSYINFYNSTFTGTFGWGTGENEVRVNWYLTMSLKVLEPAGAPLVNGTVNIRNALGLDEVQGLSTGPSGRPPRLDLREKTITSERVVGGTPHTITVTWGEASDGTVETMDRNRVVDFALDTTPPTVSLAGPVEGGVYNFSAFRVVVEGADAVRRAAKGPWRLALRVDNGSWDEVITTGFENASWAFDIDLSDGPHLVGAYVRDASGNRATVSVSFSIDTTAPTISVLYPPGDFPPTNRTSITVMGTTDPDAVLTIGGEAVELGPTGSFTHTVVLVEGPNRITLVAVDSLGNRNVVHIDITVDTTPPSVVLGEVEGMTNASAVRVSGTKEGGATLYVNGPQPALTGAVVFDVLVPLVEGMNQIFVESVDAVGNSWHTTLTVVRDSTPPPLSVVPPPAQTRYARVTVQGNTEIGATVRVNGLPVDNLDGSFSMQLELLPGANVITIEAADAIGNSAVPSVFTVTLDTVVPTLVITSKRQVSTDLDHTQLAGRTDAGVTVRVRVTYGAYTKMYVNTSDATGAFSFRVEMPQIGSHSVVVTVEDAAGNTASETLTYERVFPQPPKPDGGDGSTWFADNWVYMVLAASILLSGAILLIVLVPSKRQREARRKLAEARAARAMEAAAAAESASDALEDDDGTDGEGRAEEGSQGADGAAEEGTAAPGRAGGDADRGWEEMPDDEEGEPEADEGAEEADK